MGRRESRIYEDMINGGRTSFLTAPGVQGLLEGGVPILKDGQVIGAVGVSGVKSNEDAQIAKAGIAALGL
jgi:glc operon protein GlcG